MTSLPRDPSSSRLRLLVLLTAGVWLAGLVGCRQEQEPEQSWGDEWGEEWNVLLVTLDTVRADRLGCYGNITARTPHLDNLAEEGIRFERAISTAGLTPVAHASILTGRNPYSHGLRVMHGELEHRLPEEVPSLAELLSARGWRTAAFVSSYSVAEAYGLARGYQRFSTGVDESVAKLDLSKEPTPRAYWVDDIRSFNQRRGDHTTDEALTWLEQFGTQGPWHIWLHLFDVHDLSLVPPETFAKEAGVEYDRTLAPTDRAAREAIYDLELSFVDQQIGRLVEHLQSSGQYERTLIIVVADHGQGLSEGAQSHEWTQHRLLYDWAIRVPLILRIPDQVQSAVVPELVRTIDILPTVLESLELVAPAGIEGRSVLPILRGELDEPRVAYADALNLEDTHSPLGRLPELQRDNLHVAMDQRWKLILHTRHNENSELFDLETDPGELKNVFAEHPEVVARLRRFLDSRDALRLSGWSAGEEKPEVDDSDEP